MFDEIFKRWINTGQLSENDVVSLFLEWDQTFGDGKGTPQEVISLLHVIHTDYYRIMCKILKYVGIKKDIIGLKFMTKMELLSLDIGMNL